VAFAVFRLGYALFGIELQPVPDELLLSITLGLVAYLWVRQMKMFQDLDRSATALQDSHVKTISALVKTVEAKDAYTQGHSDRVRDVAVEIGKKMGLDVQSLAVVSRAAMLHDIGKLGIQDAILHKKEPLTDTEWQILRDHPRRTDEILSTLGFLDRESRIALLHHERWDGKGYAVGLKNHEIPVESCILAVADCFDAMNSRRPYRERLPRETVMAELDKGRGSQHRPAVVDALFDVLREQPEMWARGLSSSDQQTSRPVA